MLVAIALGVVPPAMSWDDGMGEALASAMVPDKSPGCDDGRPVVWT